MKVGSKLLDLPSIMFSENHYQKFEIKFPKNCRRIEARGEKFHYERTQSLFVVNYSLWS